MNNIFSILYDRLITKMFNKVHFKIKFHWAKEILACIILYNTFKDILKTLFE